MNLTRGVAAMAAATLFLVACGGDDATDGLTPDQATGTDTTQDDATEDDAGSDADAVDGDVDLMVLGWSASPAENEALEAVLDAYPDANVSLTLSGDFEATLRSALAAGDPPDVFYVDSSRFPDLVAEDVLHPTGDDLTDPDDFLASLRDTFSADGRLVCPPKDYSVLALQYNTELLDAAGVEPPTTWDELSAAAEALTTDDQAGIVIAPELARLGVFLHQGGGSVLNGDGTSNATSAGSLEGLRYIEQLFAESWAATPAQLDAGWGGEAFGQGKAAMAIEGNWIIGALTNEFPDLEYGSVPLPSGPAGDASYAFTVCYGVAARSDNIQAATALVDYLTQTPQLVDFTRDFPVIPSRGSAAEQWAEANPDASVYVESAEFAVGWQFPVGFQPALDDINDTLQGLTDGSLNAETAAERIEQTIGDVLG